MKRYSVFGMGLAEDPAGSWVKFAEVEQQLAEVEARRQRLEAIRVASSEFIRQIDIGGNYSTAMYQCRAAIKAAGGEG